RKETYDRLAERPTKQRVVVSNHKPVLQRFIQTGVFLRTFPRRGHAPHHFLCIDRRFTSCSSPARLSASLSLLDENRFGAVQETADKSMS
ncbi:MAG: hypothetical protein WAN52_25845, partial [Pseudolabrys sp.]